MIDQATDIGLQLWSSLSRELRWLHAEGTSWAASEGEREAARQRMGSKGAPGGSSNTGKAQNGES